METSASLLSEGFTESARAATPAAMGDENDVPYQ
jgi:hypothetical protein